MTDEATRRRRDAKQDDTEDEDDKEGEEMTRHRISRTGQVPLEFKGEVLARAGGKQFRGRDQVRWYELTLYESDGGQYVLAISYRTEWRGEPSDDWAMVVEHERFTEVLGSYDPTAVVQGFPDRPENAERQASLLDHMRRMYEQTVTDLLRQAGPAEAIE